MKDTLLTKKQAAKMMNVHPKFINYLENEGRLFADKEFPFKRWRQSKIEQYLKDTGIATNIQSLQAADRLAGVKVRKLKVVKKSV